MEEVIAQPYKEAYSNRMGLSVYVRTNDEKEQNVSFEIKNPDGSLTWNVNAKRLIVDNAIYYGSSDICMPSTRLLDLGDWTLTVMSQDGSAEEFKFNVNYYYGRPDGTRNKTYYDENLNLTFVYY